MQRLAVLLVGVPVGQHLAGGGSRSGLAAGPGSPERWVCVRVGVLIRIAGAVTPGRPIA
jgi:hypothetical protein